ncbi:hypothetical protein Taro_005872, partial [Colocasia esculenta]|nr:hypothetical protein [Colocasia esculenta]
ASIRRSKASSGVLLQLEARGNQGEGFPTTGLAPVSTKNPKELCFGGFLGLTKESFFGHLDPFGVFTRGKYPTHNVHIGTWCQCLDAKIQVCIQRSCRPLLQWPETAAKKELLYGGLHCYVPGLRTEVSMFVRLFRAKFVPEHVQDWMEQEFLSLAQGSMTVLEYEERFSKHSKYAPHIVADKRRKTKKIMMGLKPSLRMRLVVFDHRTLDEALSATCRQEGEMEQYLEEKKASQKRPTATFQWQDKKKAVYQTPQRSMAVGSSQVPSVRSPGVKKECPHCGKTHGGTECWMITGKCLKCGSSDHKIKDCPRLQQGVQLGAPAPAI